MQPKFCCYVSYCSALTLASVLVADARHGLNFKHGSTGLHLSNINMFIDQYRLMNGGSMIAGTAESGLTSLLQDREGSLLYDTRKSQRWLALCFLRGCLQQTI
jgi:hypothetical protein